MKYNNIGIYSRFEPGTEKTKSLQYFNYLIGDNKKFPSEISDNTDKLVYNGYFPLSKLEFNTLIENIKSKEPNYHGETHYNYMCVGFFEKGVYNYNKDGIRLDIGDVMEPNSWLIKKEVKLPDECDEAKSIMKTNSIINTINQKILAAKLIVYSNNNESLSGVKYTSSKKLEEYVQSKGDDYIFNADELLQFLPKINWHPYNSNQL
ncbi:MAG: hypothetical protein ACP5NV_01420 [Candidatus Woesearchaeota archaeon]